MATQTVKLTTQIGDEVRDMTDTERAQYLVDQQAATNEAKEYADTLAAQAAAKASAQNKLAALGLTADEIAAL